VSYKLHTFDKVQQAAQGLADWVSAQVLAKAGPFHLALAGGNTPIPFFEIFSQQALPWQQLWFYWSDERCVPPTDPQSNYGQARKHLLSKLLIPKAQIERMRGELDPEAEALRYSELLERRLPLEQGMPVLDLVLLGLGDDGHTASLFPGDLAALESADPVVATMHPVSGQQRLSMTPRLINQARQVAFLVTGASKAEILRQVLSGAEQGIDTEAGKSLPAQWIQPERVDGLHFFVGGVGGAELELN
jgi:6-phosphogluconolactonase